MTKRLEDYPHLERLVNEGYHFDLSAYLSKGFDLFKQDVGGFVGYTLIFFAISAAASFIPFASLIAGPPLAVGWAIVAYNIVKRQHYNFNEFFEGFNDFGQLLLVTLVTAIILFGTLIPAAVIIFGFASIDFFAYDGIDFGDASPSLLILGIFAVLVPIVYLGVAWSWSSLFVVFYKMQFWDAMEASRKIISKNWSVVFLFSILVGLIGSLGVLALGVGILFTMPIAYCMQYVAFAEVTGLHDGEVGNRLEDHLVE